MGTRKTIRYKEVSSNPELFDTYNHRTGNPILTAGVLYDFARGKYNINLVSFIKSRALNQVNIS